MKFKRLRVPHSSVKDFSSITWQRWLNDLNQLLAQLEEFLETHASQAGAGMSLGDGSDDNGTAMPMPGPRGKRGEVGPLNSFIISDNESADYDMWFPPAIHGDFVPFNGATKGVDLNGQHLINVAHLGVGQTTVPDILARFIGDNGATSRIAMRGYSSDAAGSAIRVTKYRGTFASPAVVQAGDTLGTFEFAGYSSATANGARGAYITAIATQLWTSTANGTQLVLGTVPNDSIVQTPALTINQNQAASFVSTVSSTGFTGPLTGDVTGNVSGSSGSCTGNSATATLASTVTVADTTSTTCSVGLFESATGSLGCKTDGGLTYNASTGVLTATGFAGPLTGNVTGNVSGSSGSCTGLSATATALATPRAIYGNNFDGTAALTQIIASTYGGTGNGFTKFSGPTTAEKTKTVRDANDTILELGGSYTPTATWNWTTATVTWPTFNQNTSGTAANLSGTPALPDGTTATTQALGDNTTKLATTAFVIANAASSGISLATARAVTSLRI